MAAHSCRPSPRGRSLFSGLLSRLGLALGLAAATLVPTAHAQIGSARYASIIVDNDNGQVLEAVNADAPRYPASLTKLMTLYMTFEALRDHRITLNEEVPITEHAASMEPSKLGLRPGTHFTVEDGILAIVTKSANDAACALGEFLGGDEPHFAQMMTQRARGLGMTRTTFRNASGLPDLQQTTTARDLALLAHHLVQDFPDQYHYFSVPNFYFHRQLIPNHDHMLTDYEGADGLKTGYTLLSGHNLVTSAVRGNVRLIGVVMGARSNPERDAHMASLLDDGFEQLGVPVMRRAMPRTHLPGLLATAGAARSAVQLASYHVGRHHRGHLVRLALHRSLPGQRIHATYAVAHGHLLVACHRHGHHHCGLTAHEKRAT